MTAAQLLGSGGAVVLVLSLIQLSPIRINPWTWLARSIGRAIHGDVMDKLAKLQTELETHIADGNRARILDFNGELIRDLSHTQEAYIEILAVIDVYEAYCDGHPDYPNNRATLAIANIKRVYNERLQKRDFT